MLRLLRWYEQSHAFLDHFHSDFFISVTLQGECRFSCEGRDYVGATGWLSIIPPFHVHSAICAANVAYHAVYLNSNWMRKWMPDCGDPEKIQWTSPYIVHDLQLSDDFVLSIQGGCMDEISQVAEKIIRLHSRPVETSSGSIAWRQSAMQCMRHAVAEHLPISYMAAQMGMSVQGFSRAFVRHFGVTPVFFKRQLRMEAAEDLLLGGEQPIQVAFNCGYADQAHFNRELKAARGTTPGQYPAYYQAC